MPNTTTTTTTTKPLIPNKLGAYAKCSLKRLTYFVLVVSPLGKENSGSKSQFLVNNVPSVVALLITWKAYTRINRSL
jgi:hypothetical protein